jgi:hypothetical protein
MDDQMNRVETQPGDDGGGGRPGAGRMSGQRKREAVLRLLWARAWNWYRAGWA